MRKVTLMLALALVLLVVVAMLVVASFVGSSEEVVVEFLNVAITTSVGGVFVSGFVAGLVALASLYSIRTSVRRIQKRRSEVEELRRQAEQAAPPGAAGTDRDRAKAGTDRDRADTEAITTGSGATRAPDEQAGPYPDEQPPARGTDAEPPPPSDTHRH